jgi:hypothetical protein
MLFDDFTALDVLEGKAGCGCAVALVVVAIILAVLF